MDLRQFFGALRARWRVLVTVTLVGLGWSAWLLASAPTMYSSSATIFLSAPPSGVTNTRVASLLMEERAHSYAHLVIDSTVIVRSVERLQGGLTTDDLRDHISADVVESTLLVVIKAKADSPERAQQVASVVADETLRLVEEVESDVDGTELPIVATLAAKPTRNTSPAEPDLLIGSVVGLVLSLMTGLAAALLRETLDKTVSTVADVRKVTGSSPLAMVPAAPADSGRSSVLSGERRGPLVEAFNMLRTNLQFTDLEAGVRTILVTSARSEEGATFVAGNLATAMARVGRSVVLLDANLRWPSIRVPDEPSEDAGLVPVLVGRTTLEDAIEVDETGVHVLPAGPVPPNPAEILDAAAMRALLTQLRERYDVVVIDTSALLVHADAAALLSEVDATLLVIPYGSSQDRLKQAVARIEQAGARLSGVVVSGVPGSATMRSYDDGGARAGRDREARVASKGRRAGR